MRSAGAGAANAGGTLLQPPAFHIIVLVSVLYVSRAQAMDCLMQPKLAFVFWGRSNQEG